MGSMAAARTAIAILVLSIICKEARSVVIGGGSCKDSKKPLFQGEEQCHGQICKEEFGKGECKCDEGHVGEHCETWVDYRRDYKFIGESEMRLEGKVQNGKKTEGKIEQLDGDQDLTGVRPDVLVRLEHPFIISTYEKGSDDKKKYVYLKAGTALMGENTYELLAHDEKDDDRNVFLLRRLPENKIKKGDDGYLLFNVKAQIYVHVPEGDGSVEIRAKYIPMSTTDEADETMYDGINMKISSYGDGEYIMKVYSKRFILDNGIIKAGYVEPYNAQRLTFIAISIKTSLSIGGIRSPSCTSSRTIVEKCYSFPKDSKEKSQKIKYAKTLDPSIFKRFVVKDFSLDASIGVSQLLKAKIDDKNWINALRTKIMKTYEGSAEYDVKTSNAENTCVLVILQIGSCNLPLTVTAYTTQKDNLVNKYGYGKEGKIGPAIPGESNGYIEYYDVYNSVLFKAFTTKDECPKCG